MWNDILIFFDSFPPIVWNLLLVGLSVLTGFIIKWILSYTLHCYYRRTDKYSFFRSILSRLGKPLNYFFPLFLFNLTLPFMKLTPATYNALDRITGILLIVSFAYVLIGIIRVLEDYVYQTYDLKKQDNLRERKIRTQLQFIRKIAITIIVVLAVCAVLLSFENLRRIGAGLLTGVGIGGIIIGFAAQRSLGNLLAGFQIAFTQPIRIDDALLVEGEFGRVEEITLTYVVVNLWDKRRLVLPINYFIEKPFQNWTRNSADLLGTVLLYLDYTAPVEEIRKEFNRLMDATDLWDKKASVIQVTDANDRAMEVRALVSASNSGSLFDLRCYIRENLIAFIQKNYPECLPQKRTFFPVVDSRITVEAEPENDRKSS